MLIHVLWNLRQEQIKVFVGPDKCYGYADKNWGRDFTSPWLWLSSNNLYSRVKKQKLENSVFDVGGGRPRVFGIALDGKLLGGLFYEGREYDYNFSKPWTFRNTYIA